MELRQIHYFIAVAEAASLTRAVERLHIAQPALSQNIKNLENELGTRLFERSRQGMSLTDAGATFLEHARSIIQQVNRATASIRSFEANPSGTVSIAMPASVSNVLTVPLFQMTSLNYPNIELSLDDGLPGIVHRAFDTGLFDILLEYDTVDITNANIEPLIREDIYLITQNSEDNDPGGEIEFKDLVDYPIVLPHVLPHIQHGMKHTLLKHAREQGLELNLIPSSSALQPALKLFEAGLGCGILPWSAIYDKYDQGRIDAKKIVNPSMHRLVSMLSPLNRASTTAASKVHELIRMVVKQVHAEDKWRGELLFED